MAGRGGGGGRRGGGADAVWSILGTFVAGVLAWGLFGWALDRWLCTRFLVAMGFLVGAAGAFHFSFLRYRRNSLYPPDVPVLLYVLLTPIELVSTFLIRPMTLAVRLLANMIAGHLILGVFFAATAYLLGSLNASMLVGVGALVFAVALVAFELFVAALQAYVFTILSAIYIAGALEPEH